MKNRLNNLKSKKYFLLFVLVMLINILLTFSLIHVSFGQTKKDDFSFQQPIKTAVMEQKDSPLRIIVVSVDSSPVSYQDIVFSLQNVTDKPVRAYTLIGNGKKGSGKIITNYSVANRFLAGESVIKNLDIERSEITDGEVILLSVDYVEFEDGSSWGSDSTGNSKLIAGQREGTKAAISQLKNLSRNQNTNNLTEFLSRDMQEIVVEIPNTDQSEIWKRGFRLGYKSVISILQEVEERGIERVIEKLDDMEKIANQGGK